MFQNLRNKAAALFAVATAAVLSVGTASAAAIDVTAVTAAISDSLVPIGLIGAGVLLVMVAIKGYKWVRRAM